MRQSGLGSVVGNAGLEIRDICRPTLLKYMYYCVQRMNNINPYYLLLLQQDPYLAASKPHSACRELLQGRAASKTRPDASWKGEVSTIKSATMSVHPSRRAYVEEAEAEVSMPTLSSAVSWIHSKDSD
jgi:hypothetical protein